MCVLLADAVSEDIASVIYDVFDFIEVGRLAENDVSCVLRTPVLFICPR